MATSSPPGASPPSQPTGRNPKRHLLDPSKGQPSFLVKEEIKALCDNPDVRLIPEPFPGSFKNWSYDLRLGEEAYLSSDDQITHLKNKEAIFIEPGEFALLLTKEEVRVPLNLVAFISLKSRHAFKGLVNISGFQVDPDYHGKLALSVYNAGPNTVVLREDDPLYMIIFAKLATPADERDTEGPKYSGICNLSADMISAVKGPPVSLIKLNDRVTTLEQALYILGGVLAATIGTIIAAVVLGVLHT
jgi:dCTP deaminase